MPEATPRTSLRRFAFPAAIIAAFAAGGLLTWTTTRSTAPEPQAAPPVLAVPPPLPQPAPPLGRSDLVAAARAASAAYAAGGPVPADQAALVGRRFQIRIPFGCNGPQAEPPGAQAWWTYDPAKQTLTLTARPVDWTAIPLVPDAAGPDAAAVEAVEGFWIPRPWAEADTCPPRRTGPVAAPALLAPPTPETLGLASVFRAGGSRVLRRGERPYEVVRKVSPEDLAARREFHLVLSGRVAAVGDGQPVACRAETPDQRPVCLIAVEFERVAFEDAAGDTLAEWRS